VCEPYFLTVPHVARREVAIGEHFGGASEIQSALSQRDRALGGIERDAHLALM